MNELTASRGPEEVALVRQLRAGDERAYETLVRAYGGRLLAAARRLLRNEEDARDAVQEAFISAFRSIGRFQQDAQVSTWLHRIVVNAALMKLRTRQRKPEESIDDMLPQFSDDGHSMVSYRQWGEAGDEALRRSESKTMIRRCIDSLPETYRTVLMLRDIEEMDTEQAAQALGITPNAVKIRLHRARQALRTMLDPHIRETDE